MKFWKPALILFCCLFVVVSSYQTGKYRSTKPRHQSKTTKPPHHSKTTEQMVASLQGVEVHVASPPPPRVAAAQVSGTLEFCPTCNVVPYNLENNIFVLAHQYDYLARRVWDRSVNLTSLGTRFVAYFRSLNVNNDIITSLRGSLSTFVINYFLPFLDQKPDACFMATMINATIACVVDKNRTPIQDALDQLQDKYLYEISPRLERTIALSAGCDFRCGVYPPDPEVNKTVCYENGFVYPIQKVLNLSHNILTTSNFKKVLIQLYNSTVFKDRFFAACATFAILGAPLEVWNLNNMAEIVDLSISSPIERGCCYQRVTRVEELRNIYDATVENYISSMKQLYASNSKCV